MENNENFVEQTENVEQTTEETPVKKYTQEEVDAMMGRRSARIEKKVRREYEQRYGDLEEILKAGMEVSSVAEAREGLRSFYAQNGKPVPSKPTYSEKDIEVLARAEADDIISGGYEEVVEEVERLAAIGADNLSARDRAYFRRLAQYRQDTERRNELAGLGVTDEVYNSKGFQDFLGKFNSTTPIAEIYGYYTKQQPKKEIKQMGSIKNTSAADTGVKDFYSFEEAQKFTVKDFDENPALYEAVKKSMLKW